MTSSTVKKSPKVIFATKFLLALNNHDNKKKSDSYKKSRTSDVKRYLEYYAKAEKQVLGMFEYYTGEYKDSKVNLVIEDGSCATRKELKQRIESHTKYG